ncbi:hypothetical protein RQP46_007805 [Phenoliferia psychrophenolica]
MVSATWQTLLVIAAPLLILTLGLSLSFSLLFLSPPSNLFLDLAPSSSILDSFLPVLRTPLDIRLPTETIRQTWKLHHATNVMNEREETVLMAMKTLDARIVYALVGSAPLVHCEWCRAPSRDGGPRDHVIFLLPGLAVMYLTVLLALGCLTAGRRIKYRTWASYSLAAAATAEAYVRLSWIGMKPNTVTMLHSQIHALRFSFFAVLLLLAYYAPPTPTPDPRLASATTYLGPALSNLTVQTDSFVSRLRAVSLQRIALLHDGTTRDKITNFWKKAEEESTLARRDPAVAALRIGATTTDEDKVFRAWLDQALAGQQQQQQPGPLLPVTSGVAE